MKLKKQHYSMGKTVDVPDIISYLKLKKSKKVQKAVVETDVHKTRENVHILSGTEPKLLMAKVFNIIKQQYQIPSRNELDTSMDSLYHSIQSLLKNKELSGSQAMTVQQLARDLHSALNECVVMPDSIEFLKTSLQKEIYERFNNKHFTVLYSTNEWRAGDVIEAAILPPVERISEICGAVTKCTDGYETLENCSSSSLEAREFMDRIKTDKGSCFRGGKPGIILFKCFGLTSIHTVCMDTATSECIPCSGSDPKERIQLSRLVIKYPLSSTIQDYLNKNPMSKQSVTEKLLFTNDGWFDHIREEHAHVQHENYETLLALANKKENTLMPFMIISGKFTDSQCNPEKHMTWTNVSPEMVYNKKECSGMCHIVAVPVKSPLHNPQHVQFVMNPEKIHVCFPGVTVPFVITFDVSEKKEKVNLDEVFMDAIQTLKTILATPFPQPFDNDMDTVLVSLMEDIEKTTKTRDFEMYAQEWKKRVLNDADMQKYKVTSLLREAVEHIGDHAMETRSLQQLESMILDYELNEDYYNNEFMQQQLCRLFFTNPYFVNFLLGDLNVESILDVCRKYIHDRRCIHVTKGNGVVYCT